MFITLFMVKKVNWFKSEQKNVGRQSPWLLVACNAQIQSTPKEIHPFADTVIT